MVLKYINGCSIGGTKIKKLGRKKMRDPNAVFNTHIKTIKGFISKNSIFPQKAKIDVRFTSDSHETLSLAYNGIQIAVPFEKVWELIEETRKDNSVS